MIGLLFLNLKWRFQDLRRYRVPVYVSAEGLRELQARIRKGWL